jgi:hypothetical protein
MANMSWSVSVQISKGPTVTAAGPPRTIEATDRVEVSLAPGDADKVVDLQPGDATAIRLLLIKSTRYGADLSFKASDGATDSAKVVLDGPQLFTTGGAALFGMPPQKLKLTNTSADQTADVEIFVARDATP